MSVNRVPGPDNLYIGGVFSMRRPELMKELGITHVVSVMRERSNPELFRDYHRLLVPVHDMFDENLLQYFATSNQFIRDALAQGGAVYVHCAIGKSRSATIVIAYLLSRSKPKPLTVDSALGMLRSARPMVEPNSGFKEQLQLYHQMGCPDNIESQHAYQRWLFRKNVTESNCSNRPPDEYTYFDGLGAELVTSNSSAEPEAALEDQAAQEISQDQDDPSSTAVMKPSGIFSSASPEIRCRMCRKVLAAPKFILPHEPKTRANEKGVGKSDSGLEALSSLSMSPQHCAHIFVDPMSWMKPALEQGLMEGKFHCPNTKCKALVGRYAWQGLKCSCGQWIVPGISLSRAKVDDPSLTASSKKQDSQSGASLPST